MRICNGRPLVRQVTEIGHHEVFFGSKDRQSRCLLDHDRAILACIKAAPLHRGGS